MAPHVAAPVLESATQAPGAATGTAKAVTDWTTTHEGAGKVIATETISSETAATMAPAGQCAAGERGTSENKRTCKNNHGLTQDDDLLRRYALHPRSQ
jgi:hypothetical protein